MPTDETLPNDGHARGTRNFVTPLVNWPSIHDYLYEPGRGVQLVPRENSPYTSSPVSTTYGDAAGDYVRYIEELSRRRYETLDRRYALNFEYDYAWDSRMGSLKAVPSPCDTKKQESMAENWDSKESENGKS